MIIGLAGGKPEERKQIAAQLMDETIKSSRGYRLNMSEYDGSCEEYIPQEQHDRAVNLFIGDMQQEKYVDRGLVVTHVSRAQTAATIREHGGVIWHLTKPVSHQVPMFPHDLKVTAGIPSADVFSVEEALSETMLGVRRYGKSA